MNDNLSILSNIILFEDFKEDREVLGKIEELFTERDAKKGEVIIKEGREGDELFIIKSGGKIIFIHNGEFIVAPCFPHLVGQDVIVITNRLGYVFYVVI